MKSLTKQLEKYKRSEFSYPIVDELALMAEFLKNISAGRPPVLARQS